MEYIVVRRVFLKIILFLPMFGFSNSKNNKNIDIWKVIEEVQEIIFPKSLYFDGAKSLGCTTYLKNIVKDGVLKDRDKLIIIKGARLLEDKYQFLSSKDKKEIIHKFSSEKDGKYWFAILTEYTMEGVFSHPIYGGNIEFRGTNSINIKLGIPEPKVKYGKLFDV